MQKVSVFLSALLIFLLPTQCGKHFWPSFSFVLGQRIDYLSPTLFLTDVLSWSIITLFFIQTFMCVSFFTWMHQYIKKLLVVSLVFLFLSTGVYLSQNPFAGWYGLFKLAEYLLLSVALRGFLKKHLSLSVMLLACGVICESVLADSQVLLQHSVGGVLYFFGERTFSGATPGIANASLGGQLFLRPYGTFPHPNVLAGYLVVCMTLLVGFFPQAFSWRKRSLLLFSLFIGSLALLITLSRVASILWIVTLLFSLLLLVQKNIKRPFLKMSSILSCILCVFVVFLLTPLKDRFFMLFVDESFSNRFLLLKIAWNLFLSHSTFGVGFENFLTSLPTSFSRMNLFSLLQPVHNVYMLIAAETGLVGILFLLWCIARTYEHLFLRFKKSLGSDKWYVCFLLIAFSSMLTLSLFDHYFFTLQQGQLLTVLLFALCW